jgi:hypothetical protein
MRRFVLVAGMVAFGWLTSGCASECEKKCASQFDQAKELAGGNWGAMEKLADMGLAACKAACNDG